VRSSTRIHPRRILGLLLLAPFMAQADATIANVATPSIRAGIHASGAALELVIGGYLIAFAVLLITGARLGQTHGYKRLFLTGMAVFTLASLLCGLAPEPIVLIAARVLQGTGAALMFPQTLTGIQLSFSGAERVRAIGLYAIALSSGAVIGQLLGGALISAGVLGLGWRAIFLVNVPIGVIGLTAAARSLPADRTGSGRRLDLPGVGGLSATLLLLVFPLSLGRVEGWPLWTWLALAASLPAGAAFIVGERRLARRGGAPLVNVHVLGRRPVLCALVALMTATGTYYALLFTLAQYLQQGLGRSALISGLTLVPWVAAFGAAGQLVRRLPDRARRLAPAAGCALLTAAFLATSAALFAGDHGEVLLSVLFAAGGLGLGTQFSALVGHLTGVVPPDYAPDISGVSTTMMQIGGAIGVATFGTLYLGLAGVARAGTGTAAATHAFAVVTGALAAVGAVAMATAYAATRLPRPARSLGRVQQRAGGQHHAQIAPAKRG
jgi:MFS family permease